MVFLKYEYIYCTSALKVLSMHGSNKEHTNTLKKMKKRR